MATATALKAVAAGRINGQPFCKNCGSQVEWLTGTPEAVHVLTSEARCKNLCRKEIRAYRRSIGEVYLAAYEVWTNHNGWTWYVLAKRQIDDHKPYSIWLCACVSPYETDMAGHDTYASEVMANAVRVK